jgi:hypothetical protein
VRRARYQYQYHRQWSFIVRETRQKRSAETSCDFIDRSDEADRQLIRRLVWEASAITFECHAQFLRLSLIIMSIHVDCLHMLYEVDTFLTVHGGVQGESCLDFEAG